MTTIEEQTEEQSLEAMVDVAVKVDAEDASPEELEAAEEILDSLPSPEKEDVEEAEEMVEESEDSLDGSSVVSEMVQEEPVTTAPVGPADYESPEYVAPQVLEQAHAFLNQYGIDTDGFSPKEVMDKINKIKIAKAENAQVLSRGRALDGIERLLSFVPKGYVGEFKRENDMDIQRAETLGFKVFICDEARLESSTGTADGRVKYGDQILMIIPEELYVANRLIKAERSAERRKAHSHKGGSQIDQSGADPLFPLIKL